MTYTLGDCDLQGPYRYSLCVDTQSAASGLLLVMQCNPSNANSRRADPTVGKVAHWAAASGFGTVVFLNLFARISPYPEALRHLRYAQLVGPRNDEVIATQLQRPDPTLVLAWGAGLPVGRQRYTRRLTEIRQLIVGRGIPIHRVGQLTAGGFPRHGRMWNGDNRQLLPLDWTALTPAC